VLQYRAPRAVVGHGVRSVTLCPRAPEYSFANFFDHIFFSKKRKEKCKKKSQILVLIGLDLHSYKAGKS
jgi:hypothetical protein